MAHKNWDNVRDHRLYGYLNQKEMDKFLEAMRIKDMDQPSTAVRVFVMEHSEQIIINHHRSEYKQPQVNAPTVELQFPCGKNTVIKLLT